MTITYPLTPPAALKIRSMAWNAKSAVASAMSEFTLTEQIQAYQGDKWEGSFTLPPMQQAQAMEVEAFLLSLNGREGSFLLGPIWHTTPAGAGGAGQVDGGSQTGKILATKNWAFTTLVLKAGDYIQTGSGALTRLYFVLQDVTSDGAGLANIDIWPRLRESPTNSEALVLSNPKGTFRLANNSMPLDVSVAAFFSIDVQFSEKVP